MNPQYQQLLPLLDELRSGLEELLLGGLTAASKSSIERLDVSFKEASRMKLLRLGSTLRIANEEIGRFTSGSTQFSPRRLAFFLSRAWVLATAMRKALAANDDPTMRQLLATPPSQPLDRIEFVTLGVAKRVVPGAFASFDFRLRVTGGGGGATPGEPLIWSCVFPMRKDLDLPTEAFLQLPQKQKFKPVIFLEKKTLQATKCAISRQNGSAGRLLLSDASEVKVTSDFSAWDPLFQWDLLLAAGRVEEHRPTPLDLEIELQEEVVVRQWEPGEKQSSEEGYDLLPITTEHLPLEMRLDRGPSGNPVREVVEKMAARKARPPLYGVVHYESCRLLLQPLTALEPNGPEYLTVSAEKISQAELVKAMKFT